MSEFGKFVLFGLPFIVAALVLFRAYLKGEIETKMVPPKRVAKSTRVPSRS